MSLHLKRDDVPERKVMLKTGELKVLRCQAPTAMKAV
jgi:hypothetical protein